MTRTDPQRSVSRAEFPPALAAVVARGIACLGGRRPDFAALAALVELDPVLTGTVLRVMRSPVYGIAGPGPPLARAVEAIGHRALERILRSVPLGENEAAASVELTCRRWTYGVAVAAAARWISNTGAFEAPDEAYLAGLVHDIGRSLAQQGEEPQRVSLRTESIVHAWRLGPRIALVARWHHAIAEGVSIDSLLSEDGGIDPAAARLLGAVARGAAVASALGYGCDGGAGPIGDDADAGGIREAIELELAHAAEVLGLAPGPGAEFATALTRHETHARYHSQTDETRFVSHARTAVRVAALHREIVDTRGMTAIPDLLDRGLREIHERLEFDRVLLLEPDPAKDLTLRTRAAFDVTQIESHRASRDVEFPIDPGGAVARAIETELPCCGNDADCDRQMLERLGASSFAAVPLRAGGVSLGVVVADQSLTGRPVTEGDTAVFSMLCSALGLAMENAALDAGTKKLRALAEKDELTGINNRRNILVLLQREIDRARRYGKPLSLAMVDVDHFKAWNDLHGHQVGDQVLQAVAQLISSCSREMDAFGRYGGEEFLIVLPETPVDHAMLYAERLRATIEDHGHVLRAQYGDASLSASIGLASLNPRDDDADRMIHRADNALYAAKKHGRNRVCLEMPELDPPRAVTPVVRGVLDEL